ncbi:MAG: DMT family transporter [Aureliella sp.]
MDKASAVLASLSIVLALGAGCVMALQPAVNGRLSQFCTHNLQASVISFGVGFAALLIIGCVLQIGVPKLGQLSDVPWWGWTGGLLGAYMVTVSLWVAPSLGATRWIALVLAGQITLSLVLDHFGWLGYAQHPLTLRRVLAVGCLVLGVWGVMKTDSVKQNSGPPAEKVKQQ